MHDSTKISIVDLCPVGLEFYGHRLTQEKAFFVCMCVCVCVSIENLRLSAVLRLSSCIPKSSLSGGEPPQLFQKLPFPISIFTKNRLFQSQRKIMAHPHPRMAHPSPQGGEKPERFRSFLGSQASEKNGNSMWGLKKSLQNIAIRLRSTVSKQHIYIIYVGTCRYIYIYTSIKISMSDIHG